MADGTVSLLCIVLSTFLICHGTPSRDFAKLHKEFFAWQLEQSPLSATARDVHKYDDKVESMNKTNFADRKTKADEFYARLRNISLSDLSKTDSVSYRILGDLLTSYIEGWQWFEYQHLSPVSFLEGPQNLDMLIPTFPFNTRGDFENYIERLKKYPHQFEEIKSLMRGAVALGRTNHFHSMSRVRQQFERLQVPLNESEFYSPFMEELDQISVDETVRQGMMDRGADAVNELLGAYRDLWTFLETEYMPYTRPRIGISSLERGGEFYKACIRWYLSQDMSAQEVHDIGLREVERITGNMVEIIRKQGYRGTPGNYFRSFADDSRFTFDNKEEVLGYYRRIIFDVIDPKLPEYFSNNPELPLEVREMINDGPGGYYTEGDAQGTRPGIFWANVKRPHELLNFTLKPLVLHEANPGHHFQISIALTTDNPDFRQKMLYYAGTRVPFSFPDYTAFVEGWALYTEYLGEEMGIYDDDYELMGRYSDEIFRACRLVVDTGIHAFNWSRDDAVGYFMNYTALSRTDVEVEVDRYISIPGQALAYKIGELKIKELRARAEKELGDRFNIREFHSVVLESGAIPLQILEELVDDWIKSYPMGESVTTPGPICGSSALRSTQITVFVHVILLIILLS